MRMSKGVFTSTLVCFFAIGLIAGLTVRPGLSREAYAQISQKVLFLRTAEMVTPDGREGPERWQDPDTRIVCYVSTHSGAFSCARP